MNKDAIAELHKLIDDWAAKQPTFSYTSTKPTQTVAAPAAPIEPEVEIPRLEPPKDKRVVRTKTSGDRVYLLDEVKKSRQWVTKPEIVDSFGFTMGDVVEVTDTDLLKYSMSAPLYQVPNGQA